MRRWPLMALLLLASCESPKVVFENTTTVPEYPDNGATAAPTADPTRNSATP